MTVLRGGYVQDSVRAVLENIAPHGMPRSDLVRATGCPEISVKHALARLHAMRVVKYVRRTACWHACV